MTKILGRFLPVLLACAACTDSEVAAPTITEFGVAAAEVAAGESATFSWRTAGGAACSFETGDGAPVTPEACAAGTYRHTYAAPGSYTATFTATSPGGRATRQVSVVVTAPPSAAPPSAAPPPATPLTPRFSSRGGGLAVSFDASASAAPTGTRYRWSFGDGAAAEGVKVTHRYEAPGEYTVTLTLSTAQGSATDTQTVSVTDGADDTDDTDDAGRIVLFDGDDLSAWRLERGGAATWRLADDYMEVTTGGRVGRNDLRTKEAFADFRLHLEFWVPASPAGTAEQSRGNSGVYLQGRYEVQVLDSYGRTLSGQNDAGAVYEVSDAAVNASRPAETWQSYEITFRAARFRGGAKVSPARVSVVWNGELVQDDVVISGPTRLGNAETGGDGPLTGSVVLQDHGDPVRYRNVWLEPL